MGILPWGLKNIKLNVKNVKNIMIKNNLVYEFYGSYSCKCCGYDKLPQALEFHHLNKNSKEYSLSNMMTFSKEKIFKEFSKSVILCANCHRETHYGLHPEFLLEG